MSPNTINICLGHRPFPEGFSSYFDFHLSPFEITGVDKLIVVSDSIFGINGSCLSEYAQLLWLCNNESLINEYDFVRIIQYRRFVSGKNTGFTLKNQPWSLGVFESEVHQYSSDFTRLSSHELMNTVVSLPSIGFGANVYHNYANSHIAEDMLAFSDYLVNDGLLDENDVSCFLCDYLFIPACNTGLFRKSEFLKVFNILSKAANFLYTDAFIRRDDYQRRSMGFLLERLNSFLILKAVRAGIRDPSFGFNKLITQSSVATNTVNIEPVPKSAGDIRSCGALGTDM